MDLADIVLRIFGLAAQLQLRARGVALLLALPLIIVALVDWRVTRRR